MRRTKTSMNGKLSDNQRGRKSQKDDKKKQQEKENVFLEKHRADDVLNYHTYTNE